MGKQDDTIGSKENPNNRHLLIRDTEMNFQMAAKLALEREGAVIPPDNLFAWLWTIIATCFLHINFVLFCFLHINL